MLFEVVLIVDVFIGKVIEVNFVVGCLFGEILKCVVGCCFFEGFDVESMSVIEVMFVSVCVVGCVEDVCVRLVD